MLITWLAPHWNAWEPEAPKPPVGKHKGPFEASSWLGQRKS